MQKTTFSYSQLKIALLQMLDVLFAFVYVHECVHNYVVCFSIYKYPFLQILN